ncbi:MAG: hypothetical protein HY579_14050 [Nitrospinae bacterium]|nr:hypothetical protein [Nitrospinota bacterium]
MKPIVAAILIGLALSSNAYAEEPSPKPPAQPAGSEEIVKAIAEYLKELQNSNAGQQRAQIYFSCMKSQDEKTTPEIKHKNCLELMDRIFPK